MQLSKLQKHIIEKCYEGRYASAKRDDFYDFYTDEDREKRSEFIQKSVHKSLERLNKKGLIYTIGKKTSEKWFIQKVVLTEEGKKLADNIIRKRQAKLPIK